MNNKCKGRNFQELGINPNDIVLTEQLLENLYDAYEANSHLTSVNKWNENAKELFSLVAQDKNILFKIFAYYSQVHNNKLHCGDYVIKALSGILMLSPESANSYSVEYGFQNIMNCVLTSNIPQYEKLKATALLLSAGADLGNYLKTPATRDAFIRTLRETTHLADSTNVNAADVVLNTPVLQNLSEIAIAILLNDKNNVIESFKYIELFIQLSGSNVSINKFLQNHKNSNGELPLHVAARISNDLRFDSGKWQELISKLSSQKMNINVQNNNGETPLIIALQNNNFLDSNIEMVKALIEMGAEFKITSDIGKKALSIAISQESLLAVRLLIQKNIEAGVNQDELVDFLETQVKQTGLGKDANQMFEFLAEQRKELMINNDEKEKVIDYVSQAFAVPENAQVNGAVDNMEIDPEASTIVSSNSQEEELSDEQLNEMILGIFDSDDSTSLYQTESPRSSSRSRPSMDPDVEMSDANALLDFSYISHPHVILGSVDNIIDLNSDYNYSRVNNNSLGNTRNTEVSTQHVSESFFPVPSDTVIEVMSQGVVRDIRHSVEKNMNNMSNERI